MLLSYRPKPLGRSGSSRMYTFEPPILYSEAALRGVRSGQYPFHFRFSLAFSRLAPLGFFSGGFSSTAGYVPGNEALVFRRERLGTLQVDHLPRALSVFIRITPASLPADHRKPFGFGSGRPRQRLSAPSALKRRVTTSVPPPGAGQNTRK